MSAGTIAVCKFVGTISLGLLTGVSATLSTLTLPSLLTLSTAVTARSTVTYLRTRTSIRTSYLRHITTFSLFSAYLLSPRRFRHPYLLYTSILTFLSGPGVDFAIQLKEGSDASREALDLEAQGDDVNGEMVRKNVERMQYTENVRSIVAGLAFTMATVGLWGDGA
ncbi:hypothetical protein BU24DRAFT_421834 [Aaosphaeria arxii CBS 175.79]|uniref:DUF1772-domain-containing protein n=1 Tax=Aaosphaeria arxii CBS 175.79 TaxID=1450172 RepID=A0A6A5XRJ9_9PLEO|nr:uncharacterized protein BU24DRAFT_421834 [Aaosphaeria arxii CBS 175.79]KAF2015529.1 hypothetical protein BU24DRAFT_421834 [Aaosphaeria arxii CBS 175.79]